MAILHRFVATLKWQFVFLTQVNAGVCIAAQKVLLDARGKTDPSDKKDLRAGVVLLPLHGVAWFLTVVALEDDLSLALDAAAALTTASVVSWGIIFI